MCILDAKKKRSCMILTKLGRRRSQNMSYIVSQPTQITITLIIESQAIATHAGVAM